MLGLGLGLPPGQRASWQPSQFPGARALFDSTRGITLNGSTVSAWANQLSGGAADMTQGAAANQPGNTGTPAQIVFDGTNDFLAGGNRSTYMTTTAKYVLAVITLRALPGTGGSLSGQSYVLADAGEWFGLGLVTVSGEPFLDAQNFTSAYQSARRPLPAIGTAALCEVRHDGTNLVCRVNGSEVSIASGATGGGDALALRMGGRTNFSAFDVRGLLIANQVGTAGDRASARAWAAAMWGGTA